MNRKRWNLPVCLLAAILCLSYPLRAAAEDTGKTDVQMTVLFGQTEARRMLDMINGFRTGDEAYYWNSSNTEQVASKGEPLAYSYALEEIAMQRAAECALSFSHTRPDGTRCFSAAAADGTRSYGENIAAGSSTAEGAFQQWREDDDDYSGQGHRRNMLNTGYRTVGIGHVYANGYHYWAQEFGYATDDTHPCDPADDFWSVPVTIELAQIKSVELKASPVSLTVAEGASAPLPAAAAFVILSDAWPGRYGVPVTVRFDWGSLNPAVAAVEEDAVNGVQAGSTTLTAAVMGQTIDIPVTVTGEQPSSDVYGISSVTEQGTRLE
ncbi:MAG: CAP domain-containing protein, partial [Oscillibacter sp.]|nr:CAP domain-containing protein [Oscillibacter sp.]